MGANTSTAAGSSPQSYDLSHLHDLCEARDFENLKTVLKANPELYPTALKCACRTNFSAFFARFDELQPDDGVFVVPKSDLEDITDPQTAELALKVHRSKLPLCRHADTFMSAVNEHDFERAIKMLNTRVSDDPPELEAELWIEFVTRNSFNRLVRSGEARAIVNSKISQLRFQMGALKFADRRVARFLLDNCETTHGFKVACAQNAALCDLVRDQDISEQDATSDYAQELVHACTLAHDDYQLKRIEHLLTKTSPNVCGGKPLMLACENGNAELLQLLVSDPRTDVNIADDLALKLAFANRHVEVVHALAATGKFTLSDRQRQMLESMRIIPESEYASEYSWEGPLPLRRRAPPHLMAPPK